MSNPLGTELIQDELDSLEFDISTIIFEQRDDTGCSGGLGVISNSEIKSAVTDIMTLIKSRFTLIPL